MTSYIRNYVRSISKPHYGWLVVPLVVWVSVILYVPNTMIIIADYVSFILLGAAGGIFANLTGAGGGVVFIPAFEQLDFSATESVATSFGIQCMGMTTGALAWLYRYRRHRLAVELDSWKPFIPSIVVVAPCSVVGLWTVYCLEVQPPGSLGSMFAWFSLVLGCTILVTSLGAKPKVIRSQFRRMDIAALGLLGLIGGAITAWLSVGVGEIMVIYLVLRNFDAMMAVASAVVVTAITVLAGIAEHLLINFHVYWQVVLFAGPGAILGALLARKLSAHLPVRLLKMIFSVWIIVLGLPVLFQ